MKTSCNVSDADAPRIIRCFLFVGIVLISARLSFACNVPVFRFALERWRADPYRLTVLHSGPLSDERRSVLKDLEAREELQTLNIVLKQFDIANLDPDEQKQILIKSQSSLPICVLQYPNSVGIQEPILTLKLDNTASDRIVDSPIRRQLIERLVSGQTAVWLMLESGKRSRDEAVLNLLNSELTRLAHELKLPELTDASEDKLSTALPLKIEFSVLRVGRDASEEVLVQSLLHSEPDLIGRDDPMLFPVFGRGRALLPLIGAGITSENIRDSASFLVGACSCEIKEQNPGFDLLLSADWNELLAQSGIPLLARQDLQANSNADVEFVPISPGSLHRNKSFELTHHRRFMVSIAVLAALVAAAAFRSFHRV